MKDDHDTRVTLRNLLEEAGYFVFSAANGVDGLALLMRIKPPALILLDMMMPIMNGEEFLAAKNRDESLAAIPVIVMSAVQEKLRVVGSKVSMKKPLDINDLLEPVRLHCGSLRASR